MYNIKLYYILCIKIYLDYLFQTLRIHKDFNNCTFNGYDVCIMWNFRKPKFKDQD